MPSSSPVADRMGEAAQVRKLLRSRKCSPPCTSTAQASASAVPMALVPRCASFQEAPLVNATRSALSTKCGSPSVCISMPRRSASTTTLWLWRTCSNRYSITGRECASSSGLLASTWRSVPLLGWSMAGGRPVGSRPAAMLRDQERARRSSTRPLGHWPESSRCWRACRRTTGEVLGRTLCLRAGSGRPACGVWTSMAGSRARGKGVGASGAPTVPFRDRRRGPAHPGAGGCNRYPHWTAEKIQ